MSTWSPFSTQCPNCKGVLPYHNYPCSGQAWPNLYPNNPFIQRPIQPEVSSDGTGCRPVVPLTEGDVRRIVQEELAKRVTVRLMTEDEAREKWPVERANHSVPADCFVALLREMGVIR